MTNNTTKKKRPSDMIQCMSVRSGGLFYESKKSGQVYQWYGYGDIAEVQYSDLMAMKSSKSPFIFRPWILILDEDLVAEWAHDLDPIYAPFNEYKELGDIFSLSENEFRKTLKDAPRGFKDAVLALACDKIRDKTLDSISILRTIDEMLGSNLQMLL